MYTMIAKTEKIEITVNGKPEAIEKLKFTEIHGKTYAEFNAGIFEYQLPVTSESYYKRLGEIKEMLQAIQNK